MKSFKTFLFENDQLQRNEDESKKVAGLLRMNSMLNPYNSQWQTDLAIAGSLTPPPPKDRMYGEKNFNSDVGVGFDLTPDGELEGNQAGFKAVSDRQKKGVKFSTAFPSNVFNLRNAREKLLGLAK